MPKFSIFSFILLFSNLSINASTIYVDLSASSGSNNGSSWANAYTNLQTAINASTTSDEIWVATGTYYPTSYPSTSTSSTGTTLSARDYSFYFNRLTRVYGGFSGNETSLNERNHRANPVILSGDIGTVGTATDNAYHVIIFSTNSTLILDGLTITGGYANGSGSISFGAIISRNTGGALCFQNSADLSMNNVSILDNYAQSHGGGIYANSSGSSISISNSIFENNQSGGNGGGVFLARQTTMDNVIFDNNSATSSGAGIYSFQSLTLNNIVFTDNTANTNGGAIWCQNGITTNNCTFYNNSATTSGGSFYANNPSATQTHRFNNTIFYANSNASSTSSTGADFYIRSSASLVYPNNSIMQLSSSSYSSSSNNQITTSTSSQYNVNPTFIDVTDFEGTDNLWMTYDDGLRLASGSLAIGAGSASYGPTLDIIGEDKPSSPSVGAYEGIYCTSSNNLPTTTSTTYTSSYKSTDENGWTHYCDASDNLLLALKIADSRAVIANNQVQLKLGSSTVFSSSSTGGLVTSSGGYSIIDRRWSVTPTTQPSVSNVIVRSYFTSTEVANVLTALNHASFNSFDKLNMYKAQTNVSGGGATAFADPHTVNGLVLTNGSTTSTTVWVDGSKGSDYFAEFEVASFSGGGGGGGASGNSLPVEFIQFDVNPSANHSANLNWATASEINNSHFEIERSFDGRAFETVGEVAGNGNSQHQITYRFLDETISPTENNVFYRLKQVDFDGAFEYSDIRVVRFEGNHLNLVAYPNPITDELTLTVGLAQGENYNIQAVDMQGTRVFEENYTFTNGIHRINTAQWTSGMYILKVASEQGSEHIKVMKK